MQGPPKTQRRAVSRIALPLGGVGASGGLGALAVLLGHDTAAAIACGAGSAMLAVVTVVCTALPGIIKARADAYAKREPIRQRTILLEHGMKQNIDARDLLQYQPIDGGLLRHRQRGDAALPVPEQRSPSSPSSAGEPESGLAVVHSASPKAASRRTAKGPAAASPGVTPGA